MFSPKPFYRVFLFFLLLTLMLTPTSAVRAGGVRYAAPSAMGSGNCSSWANACTLQTALAGAASGDEIWVKMGVHYPGSNRTDTFTLKNGVALYGGFAGTETMRDQRNWQTNKTILSGDIDQNDNHGGDYINENASQIVGNNAYHVVTSNVTGPTTVLDGFFITAGQANGSSNDGGGGGMYSSGSSPKITNVTFSGNSAIHYGGGMRNYSSSPTLTNVTFSGNTASGNTFCYGGGMFNEESSSPTLTNVTFSGNTASGNTASYGGGMSNISSSNPRLTNVIFIGNSAMGGGGMSNISSSNPRLTNVIFIGNSAMGGGGMSNGSSNPTLTNVTFSGNSATEKGGGMSNYSGSNPTLTNVTFSGNSANFGGGMYSNDSSSPTLTNVTFSGNSANFGGGMVNDFGSNPTLTNVTFSGNSAIHYGGGMYNDTSNPTLTNVIMWGNTATNGQGIYNSSSTPLISYSNIQNCGSSSGFWVIACGTSGGGNIAGDPLFVDADGADNTLGTADDNLRLQLTSHCIDAGKNAAVPPRRHYRPGRQPALCGHPDCPRHWQWHAAHRGYGCV